MSQVGMMKIGSREEKLRNKGGWFSGYSKEGAGQRVCETQIAHRERGNGEKLEFGRGEIGEQDGKKWWPIGGQFN